MRELYEKNKKESKETDKTCHVQVQISLKLDKVYRLS